MRRPYSISRPLPVAGKCYRNGAGQVRMVVSIDGHTLTFKVVKLSPGNWHSQVTQFPKGHIGTTTMEKFRQWLTHECRTDATVIPHNLRPPKASPNWQAFREEMDATVEG